MKKITCIQQYVIDKLIDDEKLSIGSLIDATSKVCSKEQFDNILSILIETPISSTNIPKLESKTSLVGINMLIPEEVSSSTKIQIIKIIKDQFGLGLRQAKEYVDSCVGKYGIVPKVVAQEEVDIITEKLKPYRVSVSIVGSY